MEINNAKEATALRVCIEKPKKNKEVSVRLKKDKKNIHKQGK